MSLLASQVAAATGAASARLSEQLQTLWSGYGQIQRYELDAERLPPHRTVIVKLISPPVVPEHPRAWNTPLSHTRKLQSYQVERYWYVHWASRCDEHCRVPELLAAQNGTGDAAEMMLIMEDLDAAGFGLRRDAVSLQEMLACLRWLAFFHACFIGEKPDGLWPVGSYWHWYTRPDEWQAMPEGPLKKAAETIDQQLSAARFQTLIHGDAKLANFCFSPSGQVAAVDFQYVGGGCGMKDVAYFIGSCLDAEACEQQAEGLLDHYFGYLEEALAHYNQCVDGTELEREWRGLYSFAWADFQRFLEGWKPCHWKLNRYSQQMTEQALSRLREASVGF